MKEEHSLHETLHQVDEVVVAPNVRKLVDEDRLKLVWREPEQHRRR